MIVVHLETESCIAFVEENKKGLGAGN